MDERYSSDLDATYEFHYENYFTLFECIFCNLHWFAAFFSSFSKPKQILSTEVSICEPKQDGEKLKCFFLQLLELRQKVLKWPVRNAAINFEQASSK